MLEKRLEVLGVSCQNCIGACCRAGGALEMTEDEVYKNRRRMKLRRLIKARKFPQAFLMPAEGFARDGTRVPEPTPMVVSAYHGLYLMEEDCGNLTPDNRCAIHDSPDRPRACSNYEAGSAACLGARQAFGVETPPLTPES